MMRDKRLGGKETKRIGENDDWNIESEQKIDDEKEIKNEKNEKKGIKKSIERWRQQWKDYKQRLREN